MRGDSLPVAIADHAQGATIAIQVTPRASRTEIIGSESDILRVRVAAPPVEGAANTALTRFLAEMLGVPRSTVRVISGQSGRRKRVLVTGLDARQLAQRLAPHLLKVN